MPKILERLLPMLFCTLPALLAQENLHPLSEVVLQVVERNPGVRAGEADKAAARSEARRAETLRLPKLYISTDLGAGKFVNDVANVLLTGLTPASVTDPTTRSRLGELSRNRPFVVPGARFEENLFDGGRTDAAIRSAWLTESKAEVAGSRMLDDEVYKTASEFVSLAQGQILSRYLEEYAHVAELAATALAEQARTGRITDARALAGKAKFQAAQADLENTRDDLRFTSELLRHQAGLPKEAAFDTRPFAAQLEDFNLSLIPDAFSLEKNAALRDAVINSRLQEQQVRAARSHRLPEVRFVAEYGFTFSSLLFTFRPGYNVGVRVNYPLFTSREAERNIQTEVRRLDSASLREEQTRLVLQEDYDRLLAENRKLGRQIEPGRAQLAQAEELYRVARLKYEQGAGAPSDLLEAAELLLNSRQHCLEISRSSLLLRWRALQFRGALLAELEGGARP